MDIRNKARQTTIGGPVEISKIKSLLCKIGIHSKKTVMNIDDGKVIYSCIRCGTPLKVIDL